VVGDDPCLTEDLTSNTHVSPTVVSLTRVVVKTARRKAVAGEQNPPATRCDSEMSFPDSGGDCIEEPETSTIRPLMFPCHDAERERLRGRQQEIRALPAHERRVHELVGPASRVPAAAIDYRLALLLPRIPPACAEASLWSTYSPFASSSARGVARPFAIRARATVGGKAVVKLRLGQIRRSLIVM
jgi:hypothetical protein